MQVKLSRLWFGPDGARYRPGVHELPASFEDKLPSTAEILPEPEVETEPELEPKAKAKPDKGIL